MRFLYLMSIPLTRAAYLYREFARRSKRHSMLSVTRVVLGIALILLVPLQFFSPVARPISPIDLSSRDPSVIEVLKLADMIRWITIDRLPEGRVLRYAGLIYHASQEQGLNPLEIIAIIMAESEFKENSVNTKTGDYGLGQINWEHWGKPNGLTSKDLLDPSINIYFTCLVYKFFDRDFGKYHRGNGIKCKTYLLNVKGILSTLNAFVEMSRDDTSNRPNGLRM